MGLIISDDIGMIVSALMVSILFFIRRCRKPATLGGGYKAIVKCDKFCYTHLTIFNVLHSTVKLRLNCEYAVT